MSSSVSKTQKASIKLLIYVILLFVLLLTSNNIQVFLSSKKVLGIQTNVPDQKEEQRLFWNNFLTKNPNYIPGWIEIGRMDVAREIDPNY